MIQLILVGVMLLAAGGAWWSHDRSQQEIGKAKAEAEYQRQQKEAEAANALKALEGEAFALKLLQQAESKNRRQAAELSALRQQRVKEDDERARADPEFKAWADADVPAYVARGLRDRAVTLASTARSRLVPVQSGVPAVTGPSDTAGTAHESWFEAIRRRLNGLRGSGVEPRP